MKAVVKQLISAIYSYRAHLTASTSPSSGNPYFKFSALQRLYGYEK